MMFLRMYIAAGAVALIAMPVTAPAQVTDAELDALRVDGQAIMACYEGARDTIDPPCIGAAANECMLSPAGSTTSGINKCLNEETEVWDRILNENYQKLHDRIGRLEQDPQDLVKAQRGWMQMRDADCSLAYDAAGGGSIRTNMHHACMMISTARRSLELRRMLAPMEGG